MALQSKSQPIARLIRHNHIWTGRLLRPLVERVERIWWIVVLRLVQVVLPPFCSGSVVQRVGRVGVG
jgi:hypothetical protein